MRLEYYSSDKLKFDLAWKLLKEYLEDKMGVICYSPKGTIREAFKQGIIDYDEYWLKIVDIRNEIGRKYLLRTPKDFGLL